MPEKNKELSVSIAPPNGKAMTFKADIVSLAPSQELRWVGHFIAPWIFRGEHYFKLSANEENHTLLVHGEMFSGCLHSLMWSQLDTKTRQGFINMNENLKDLFAE
jgi:hypothetical protein